jgi:hypothetical protein
MIRSIFLALALLLPVTWTVAKAADPAPAGDSAGGEKKEKKAKKGKKADGAEGEKKSDAK